MLDLTKYSCLGAALRDALDRYSTEVCLIEAERDREKLRLTYSDFKEMSLPLARALGDADFDASDRAAIIMTNQSKWLIRSEERRVGKECRSRWSQDLCKKKEKDW